MVLSVSSKVQKLMKTLKMKKETNFLKKQLFILQKIDLDVLIARNLSVFLVMNNLIIWVKFVNLFKDTDAKVVMLPSMQAKSTATNRVAKDRNSFPVKQS